MSLAKWGRRHDYFASDLRSGVPILRGSPYRSYTGSGAVHAADSRRAHTYTCTFMFSTSARTFEYSNVVVCSVQSKMPNPYSMDLRWRVVWLSITYH